MIIFQNIYIFHYLFTQKFNFVIIMWQHLFYLNSATYSTDVVQSFIVPSIQGIIAESIEHSGDRIFSLVESGKTGVNSGSCEELPVGDEDGEGSVASVEDQLRKEMTIYEVLYLLENLYVIKTCMKLVHIFEIREIH